MSKSLRSLTRTLITVAIAGTVGSSLALVGLHTRQQPQSWMQCFDGVEAPSEIGTNASEAIMAVRSARDKDQRRLQAHERALDQLTVDSRWSDPEQRQWLELATAQTRAQITDLRVSEAEAEDTEGCLEQF